MPRQREFRRSVPATYEAEARSQQAAEEILTEQHRGYQTGTREGVPDKVVRRKRGNAGSNVTLKRGANVGYTQNTQETAELLLETFFPDDDAHEDEEVHAAVRARANEPIGNKQDDTPFTRYEVDAAFKSMNAKKAPEPEVFEALFNKCLELGALPRCWKKQLVRVIPKAEKLDASDVKSYRPISLLPVIGKTLDSLLINRIEYHVFANRYMSDNQYDFRRGRAEYSAAILLDISGAFDHAWWPQIKNQLSRKDCPRMASAYFSEHKAVIEEPGLSVSRRVTRGCPQGSRSGPGYWNIVYDSVFQLDLGKGCEIVAFADDTTLLDLTITTDNYAVAWAILRGRYDSKKLIIRKRILSILDLPSSIRENSIVLRQIVNRVEKYVKAMKALNLPTDQWDDWTRQLQKHPPGVDMVIPSPDRYTSTSRIWVGAPFLGSGVWLLPWFCLM
ncbi:hypothetical protein Trydic_g2970 [Trypoxylus dichotomus]